MGLFDVIRGWFGGGGRPPPPDGAAIDAGIDAFWAWWGEAQAELLESVASGLTPALISTMSDRVAAIHPDLGWEFSKGSTSLHSLALTGEGDPLVRVVAERWRRRGPGDDATWAFHATKPPLAVDQVMTTSVGLGSHELGFSELRVCIVEDDPIQRLWHVEVWHPAFSSLPTDVAGRITFLALDSALGEDAVERWLGTIAPTATEPAESMDLAELRALVDARGAEQRDEDWVVAEGRDGATGQPYLFVLDRSIKRWDHPLFDTAAIVHLPYDADENGMPANSAADVPPLDAFEDALTRHFAGDVAHVGRRTGGGERLLYLYADGMSDVPDRIRAWADAQPVRAVVEVLPDPRWDARP